MEPGLLCHRSKFKPFSFTIVNISAYSGLLLQNLHPSSLKSIYLSLVCDSIGIVNLLGLRPQFDLFLCLCFLRGFSR